MARSSSIHLLLGETTQDEMVDKNGIARLRQANEDLKNSLLNLQGEYDELIHEKNFYLVKVNELSDIVQSKGDDMMTQLVAKSMQNAELATEMGRLKQELQVANANIGSSGIEREQNKRMSLELSDIVYSLKSIKVDDVEPEEPVNEDSCHRSFRSVKAKVAAILEDRRLLAERCQDLEKESIEKDEKIAALEAQFHLLNSMNMGRGSLRDSASVTPFPPSASFSIVSNASSSRPLTEIEIGSVKSSTQESTGDEINTELSYVPLIERSGSSNSKTSSVSSITGKEFDVNHIRSLRKMREDEMSYDTESSTKPSSLSSSYPSPYPSHSMASFSSDREIQSLKTQLAESKDQHRQFKEVCQTAFSKMKTVEQQFSDLQEECKTSKGRYDFLKTHLKYVINQYKSLNSEHEEALIELKETKAQMEYLEQKHKELLDEKKEIEENGANILEEEGLADDTEKLIKAYLVSRGTMKTLEEKLASAELAVEETEKRRLNGGRAYRDAVAKCSQLEQEIKVFENRLAKTEEELDTARKETLKFKEEAKHTRRRLTAYMKGKGIPIPEPLIKREDSRLLVPEL